MIEQEQWTGSYNALFQKKKLFCAQNNFLMQHISFLSTWDTFLCCINFFLLIWNTFPCNINTFLSKPNYFLCNVKHFVSTQNYFSCNAKFLFWASFRMLCHGDIFLLSHSNKNIITCKKINQISSLCNTKKLISFLVHHNFFIFSFYITHFQHIDLLCSGPGNRETFNPSFTHLSDIPKQLLSKSCFRKKVSYYLGLMFVKRPRGAHILVKLQACFSQILQKLIP